MNYFIQHKAYDRNGLINAASAWANSGDAWLADLGNFIVQWLDDSEEIVVQTSGSTGEPKQISLKKKNMVSSALMTAAFFQLDKNANVLLCLPVKYIAGKMMVVRALVNGWNLIMAPPSSNPLSSLHEKIDFAAFTPMQVEAIIQNHEDDFKAIRKVIIGGAAMNAELEMQLKRFPNDVYATYGMTETITHIALRNLKADGDFFKPLPGITVGVDGEQCLWIEALHIDSGRVQTNDIVDLKQDQRFKFIGRRDNVINSGGLKIFPELLEEKLSSRLNRPFFFWKKTDARLGERLVLYVEGKTDEALFYSISEYIASDFDKFHQPTEILFVERMDRTATDKLIRKNYHD